MSNIPQILEIKTPTSGSYPWLSQKSDNPRIQGIIEKGFWVDQIRGTLVYCSLYGHSEIDYFGKLPRIAMIKHTPSVTTVVFNLKEDKP